MEILKVEDMSFTYPLCSEAAVKNVSFSVKKGEFIVLCGATGSGKSTLLRTLKRELTPNGTFSGRAMFCGRELSRLDAKESAAKIGYVMQSPEQQIVTDKVWHELAFGLENLGVPSDEISRRIAETASAFGLGELFGRDTTELSGGQKQLLALASVLVMQPELLILDEPTAQLDPIAASELLSFVRRLNSDYGITVIMTEHRLEEAVPLCDRLLVMEEGRLVLDTQTRHTAEQLKSRPEILLGMPASLRLFAKLGGSGKSPLTVREGRELLRSLLPISSEALSHGVPRHSDTVALEFSGVHFRYEKNSPDILGGLDLKIYEGELFCILGGNGSGKTSLLKAAAGLIKPYCGTIKVFGKKIGTYKNQSLYRECLAMLPQDVQTVFLKNTVREELAECGADTASLPFDLSRLLEKHPYDLSGGEQQLAALAKLLAARPRLLLLDEPTKGLDAAAKLRIISVLHDLTASGVTVAVVTHDVEFAADCGGRCTLFFDGKTSFPEPPHVFFAKNTFYTTAVSRMTRGLVDGAVTVSDAEALFCKGGSAS